MFLNMTIHPRTALNGQIFGGRKIAFTKWERRGQRLNETTKLIRVVLNSSFGFC